MPAAPLLVKPIANIFCLSGGSHTNATGPVHNPHKTRLLWRRLQFLVAVPWSRQAKQTRLSVATRRVNPYSSPILRLLRHENLRTVWCLYTGIMPIAASIDHTGPITAQWPDNALLLEVIAGEDGLDPRQYAPQVDRLYHRARQGVRGLKIGPVQEGFGLANWNPRWTPVCAPGLGFYANGCSG